ncbi:hypothetical protein Tco_0899033 [Tanacetum coccineum]
MSRLKLRNVPGEGILVRTINSSKRIYIDHPLVEASKQSGNVSYLKGTSDLGNKLFVKGVPVDVDCSKIIKVYRDCAHIANVVSLRSFEQDDQFVYMAFEETAEFEQEFIQDDLEKVGNLAADLYEKLMDPRSSIPFLGVYNHIVFWDAYTKINFIGDVSDEQLSKKPTDVEHVDAQVFDGEWKSKVNSNWLTEMEKASKHD